MNVDELLGRLEGVRKAGRGWTARCPAHQDKSASLSLAEGANGSILLNCFAGCRAGDVLGAVGLVLKDLFPRRELRDMTSAEKSELRVMATAAKWKAALGVLGEEATVVNIAANAVRDGRKPSETSMARLVLACQRIDDARAVLR